MLENNTRFSKKFFLTSSAKTVLEKRYLIRDSNGDIIETPEDMLKRVAYTIASPETNYNPDADIDSIAATFYDMMVERDFMPNSPTLMNAGRKLGQLSACFVLPVEDSIESIFETIKHTALIHKSGGGTGFSFSKLRPKNDVVKTTAGVSSGPVSFMGVFDAATEAIKQGGTRRGANMGILRIDHPDILEFIKCKNNTGKLTNFNISVALTEDFMKAVEENNEYDLINPRTGNKVNSLNARDVFNLIVENAWSSAEPGIVFLDRINRDNPTPELGEIESTNPCGEQPLLPYESCNLGSINLSNFVEGRKVQWERLANVVHNSVHFLDNVIDVNKYPLPQIEEMTQANRKIGLGIMGFAEMLIKLRIPYNSQQAVDIAEKVHAFIQQKGWIKSSELAESRGVFPNWEKSIYKERNFKLRNATVITIAPTGTISIIAGTSSGIEPIFALAFVRNVMDGQKLVEINQLFLTELKDRGLYSAELVDEILENGSLKNIDRIPKDMKEVYVVSHDISPEWHIKLQVAFQKYTENAVSKTINFPHDATIDDIRKGFFLAYKLGLKGVTIYRDGSIMGQVLTVGTIKKKVEKEELKDISRKPREVRRRPVEIQGTTLKVPTGCGNLYVTINEDKLGAFEVFAHLGKTGGCASSQSEAVSRLISLALRSGVPVEKIIKQIESIRCPKPSWNHGQKILSCPDGLAHALKWYMKRKIANQESLFSEGELDTEPKQLDDFDKKADNDIDYVETESKVHSSIMCPECGSEMMQIEGCATCPSCGFSDCS